MTTIRIIRHGGTTDGTSAPAEQFECLCRGILRDAIKLKMPSGEIRTLPDDPRVEVFEKLPDGSWTQLQTLKHVAG